VSNKLKVAHILARLWQWHSIKFFQIFGKYKILHIQAQCRGWMRGSLDSQGSIRRQTKRNWVVLQCTVL